MTLQDSIYGDIHVTSPVIIDLIHSKPMQRLKGIAQYGIPDAYSHLKSYSRFEHCVGVMILLKKLGASEEEQVAGLLHDVSHTAFSHVIDWVVGEGTDEDFQDNHHRKYIESTDIPAILQKHTMSVDRIVDYHLFGLLERDLPDLCADRIDYSLREFPQDIAAKCFASLVTKDNMIVCKDESSALLFARNFLHIQLNHWGGAEDSIRYRVFADILREALQKKIITMEDFWQTDAFVVNKMLQANDKEILALLEVFAQKSLVSLEKGDQKIFRKFRRIDPLFIQDNKLIRLSSVNATFREELEHARLENEQGLTMPLWR